MLDDFEVATPTVEGQVARPDKQVALIVRGQDGEVGWKTLLATAIGSTS